MEINTEINEEYTWKQTETLKHRKTQRNKQKHVRNRHRIIRGNKHRYTHRNTREHRQE